MRNAGSDTDERWLESVTELAAVRPDRLSLRGASPKSGVTSFPAKSVPRIADVFHLRTADLVGLTGLTAGHGMGGVRHPGGTWTGLRRQTREHRVLLHEELGELYQSSFGVLDGLGRAAQAAMALHPSLVQNDKLDSNGNRWLEISVEWPLRSVLSDLRETSQVDARERGLGGGHRRHAPPPGRSGPGTTAGPPRYGPFSGRPRRWGL
ncbi:hypothetical protein SKAU_G00072640 [Synaphobranchus kaupii]|uniref:Uncharacterized protein n=1 Tax=Synaphobranchus kaupii TaxID=118154 RepID=A0A9Q1G721_SYNKA|nr:hypothetical protein SKAU_G00072640 [Synaphobranchus kaupii]